MSTKLAPAMTIDAQACNGCGLCVRVCPDDTLAVRDGKARVVGADCLACDHCAAACPEAAIVVRHVAPEAHRLETIADADRMVQPGGAALETRYRAGRVRRVRILQAELGKIRAGEDDEGLSPVG